MKKRNYALMCAAAAGGLALLIGIGCETTSPDEMAVTIAPSYARLAIGQSITLTASGWRAYRWTRSNPGIGALSSQAGDQVVYTAFASGTQTITATPVGVSSSTNATALTSGTATLIQGDGGSASTSSDSLPDASPDGSGTNTNVET